jgi:hypothetical protein
MMEVQLHPLHEDGRKSGADQPAATALNQCSQNTGQGGMNFFDTALGDALRQCKLQKDLDTALVRWSMASRMARKMGAPADLVEKYEDRLIDHYANVAASDNSNKNNLFNGPVGQLIMHTNSVNTTNEPNE